MNAMEDISNENEKKMGTDSDIDSLDSDDWLEDSKYQVYENNCLFCNHHSRSLMYNVKHMMKKHFFFIPDVEYCVDLNGLLEYLEQKICTDFKCIWCNDSGRKMRSAEAVKKHMIDNGHCKMLFEGETKLEYSSFYDYSSSYPDTENANPDEELPELVEVIDDETYMMKLPSEKLIVHRALALYYKQNITVGIAPETIKDFSYWLQERLFKCITLGTTKKKLKTTRMTERNIRKFHLLQMKYSTQLKHNKLQKHFKQ